MKTLTLSAVILSGLLVAPALAATVSKTYTYFRIGGATLEDIDSELQRRGPQVNSTGSRHPGATRMEFNTSVTYGQNGKRCGVVRASVHVKANMILPRWTRPRAADNDTRFVWDTLSADIKRHEEHHVTIAKNHAREMEEALGQLRNYRGCEAAKNAVEKTSARILEKHDREQERFDRVEAMSFEKRLSALLQNRIRRSADIIN